VLSLQDTIKELLNIDLKQDDNALRTVKLTLTP